MSKLLAISQIAAAEEIVDRVSVVAMIQGVPNPREWAVANRLQIAATDGWAEAYMPDLDLAAITDEMVMDAVAGLLAPEPEPELPEEEEDPEGVPEETEGAE